MESIFFTKIDVSVECMNDKKYTCIENEKKKTNKKANYLLIR